MILTIALDEKSGIEAIDYITFKDKNGNNHSFCPGEESQFTRDDGLLKVSWPHCEYQGEAADGLNKVPLFRLFNAKLLKFLEMQVCIDGKEVLISDIEAFFNDGIRVTLSDDELGTPIVLIEPKQEYRIPVVWEVYGHANVKACSREHALAVFKEMIDELPLDGDCSYVDNSYKLAADEQEILDLIKEN